MGWLDGNLAAVWVGWGADSQGLEAARLSSVVGLSTARLFSVVGFPTARLSSIVRISNSSVVFRCGIIKRQGRGCTK